MSHQEIIRTLIRMWLIRIGALIGRRALNGVITVIIIIIIIIMMIMMMMMINFGHVYMHSSHFYSSFVTLGDESNEKTLKKL